ncbi:MAG: CoA transferase [Gracilibacteraceae bacterium]|nr:CoA transferase [Gracilibacteraceae bacterium]
MKQSEIPVFGNLQGVKVLSVGAAIACPAACSLFAEQGASVVSVESAAARDMLRSIGDCWTVEHRNNRTIALDIRAPEGKTVLKKMIKRSDILIESSKGGAWAKWDLADETLWEINPRLVVAHISGYGQTGDPAYVSRASYDPIGQAFSGFLAVNGTPEAPLPVKPYTCDYVTALFTAWAALAALYRTRETGRGESIDVTQFEAMARIQADYLMDGLNRSLQAPRMGIYGNAVCALPNVQVCGDGNFVMTAIGGAAIFQKLENLIGLGGDPDFTEPHGVINRDDHPRGEKIRAAMSAYCAAHTAEEVNEALNALQIPCSAVMTYEMMKNHPHYLARGTFTSWLDPGTEKEVLGVNAIPFFKNNPSRIYRGGPRYGEDNEDILQELEYGAADIARLYETGVINK